MQRRRCFSRAGRLIWQKMAVTVAVNSLTPGRALWLGWSRISASARRARAFGPTDRLDFLGVAFCCENARQGVLDFWISLDFSSNQAFSMGYAAKARNFSQRFPWLSPRRKEPAVWACGSAGCSYNAT